MLRSSFVLSLFLVLPFWVGAYEDPTKSFLQNQVPVSGEEAAAHERSFRRAPAIGVSPSSVNTDKPTRKLGNTPVDQCIKKKIDELTKDSIMKIDVSTPFGQSVKEFLLTGDTSSISLEENQQVEKDCEAANGIQARFNRNLARMGELVSRTGKAMWQISGQAGEAMQTNFNRNLSRAGEFVGRAGKLLWRVSETIQNKLDPVNWFKPKSK